MGNEIKCYTCKHRYYTDSHGFNPYCENVCGDGDCYKAYEPDDAEQKRPSDGCWNCFNFDWKHEACTLRWNNMDESYYNPDIDDRKLTDYCEYHDEDPDVDPADCFD